MINRILLSSVIAAAGMIMATPSVLAAQSPAMEYSITQGIFSATTDESSTISRIDFTVAVVKQVYPLHDGSVCLHDLSSRPGKKFSLLFQDVTVKDSFAKDLCKAMMAGIVHGHDGRFRPYDPITVAEASYILAHAEGFTYPGLVLSKRPWYWSSMESLRQKTAISLTAAPDALLTRGDVAQMFFALRNVERFPLTRIIGMRGLPVADSAPASTVRTPCSGVSCKTEEEKAVSSTVSVHRATPVRRLQTPAERPSRRALLRSIKKAGRL